MIENEIQIIGILINSLIAIVAIGTLIYQRIYNTKALDYSLHPVFEITDFCPNCTPYWTPKLCISSESNSKHFCSDDHWFNITNKSKGPAFEFKSFLIHKKEVNNNIKISDFKNRFLKRGALVNEGVLQYKIPVDAIPFKYYNQSTTEELFLIIEYKTVNLNSKFRQIIKLNCSPKIDRSQITDWKNAIEIGLPEVESLKKVNWWRDNDKTLLKELKNIE